MKLCGCQTWLRLRHVWAFLFRLTHSLFCLAFRVEDLGFRGLRFRSLGFRDLGFSLPPSKDSGFRM